MDNSPETHTSHIVPLRTYLGIGSALFILTGLTVWISQIPLGGWNVVVALLIAGTKAILVALVFMHLFYDKKIYLIVFISAILILTIFIMLTMFDVVERGVVNPAQEGPIVPQSEMYKGRVIDTTAAALEKHGESRGNDSTATGQNAEGKH